LVSRQKNGIIKILIFQLMWITFGHEQVKNILEKQLGSGHFYNSYLFAGPEGVGKKQLALEFAAKILKSEKIVNHPDFQILDAGCEEIKMEAILEFIARLSLRPFLGQKKVAVINNAQNLNMQSSNALLKSLEEPPESTVIILISNSRKLLPTIISRCQLFSFSGFSEKQLKAFAQHQGLSVGANILALSFGSPAKLMALTKNTQSADEQTAVIEEFKNIKSYGIAERLLSIAKYAADEQQVLEKKITDWCSWQFLELKNSPGSYKALSALTEAHADLKKNKNKKLILQSLFLKV